MNKSVNEVYRTERSDSLPSDGCLGEWAGRAAWPEARPPAGRWRPVPLRRLESLRRAWGTLALVLFNSGVLLLLLNLVLWLAFGVLDERRARAQRQARSPETLSRYGEVHPGLDREQIQALWEETYLASTGFVYEPFTQYRLRPFAGRWVTIDEEGFRRQPGTGPWPPDREAFNIFLYGGSTAFGYGVQDDETVAAHLERRLAGAAGPGRSVRVYNFGRAGYFSTQERLLFERHLAQGLVPHAALFLDGLNDSRIADNQPIFSDRLRQLFEPPGAGAALGRLPMMRLARALTGGDRRQAGSPAAAAPAEQVAARMARHYLANLRMIRAAARAEEVSASFVWQPISFYAYDRTHHLFPDATEPPHVVAGYARMAEIAAAGQLGDSFLWLGDMQLGLEEPLYVDAAHYSGPMGRRIAARIGDWLLARGALGG